MTKSVQEIYDEKKMSAQEALALIQDNDYVFSSQGAAEPAAILDHLEALLKTGVTGVTLNTCMPLKAYPAFHNPEFCRAVGHNCWFFTKDLVRAQRDKLVSAVPESSTSVVRKAMSRIHAENRRPVLMTTVSPMDENGDFTLSVSTIFERDLIDQGAHVIVEVSPHFPKTYGDTRLNVQDVIAVVESTRTVPCVPTVPYTETDRIIAKNVAALIEDGSTIQLGVGGIPNAVANELKTKKHLGIHTELFAENMVDLIECGAVDNSQKGFNDGKSVCAFALGSQKLYDFIDNNPDVLFKACTYTNDPPTIAKNNKFVSVNAALEIDLTGQAASETIGNKQISGTGGQSETVQGAQLSNGGKSVLAMHSTYTATDAEGNSVLRSKIVPFLAPGAAVSTSRNDVDYVVTEYGTACLRGRNIRERAEALTAIAHPDFRESLRAAIEKYEIW